MPVTASVTRVGPSSPLATLLFCSMPLVWHWHLLPEFLGFLSLALGLVYMYEECLENCREPCLITNHPHLRIVFPYLCFQSTGRTVPL